MIWVWTPSLTQQMTWMEARTSGESRFAAPASLPGLAALLALPASSCQPCTLSALRAQYVVGTPGVSEVPPSPRLGPSTARKTLRKRLVPGLKCQLELLIQTFNTPQAQVPPLVPWPLPSGPLDLPNIQQLRGECWLQQGAF